jgi:hypothetical protein
MEIQSIGLVAAAATFFGVWFGHVAVRKVEFSVEKLWLPIGVTLVVGLGLETWSLFANNKLLAAATGILGMTLLWDSFEFWRQQKRVIKGHAPANPDNLRHARILADSQDATTLDLLKRDPVGHPVRSEEAVQLVVEKR